jgi:hypothetical protein
MISSISASLSSYPKSYPLTPSHSHMQVLSGFPYMDSDHSCIAYLGFIKVSFHFSYIFVHFPSPFLWFWHLPSLDKSWIFPGTIKPLYCDLQYIFCPCALITHISGSLETFSHLSRLFTSSLPHHFRTLSLVREHLVPLNRLSIIRIHLDCVGNKVLYITFTPTNLIESLRSSQISHPHIVSFLQRVEWYHVYTGCQR